MEGTIVMTAIIAFIFGLIIPLGLSRFKITKASKDAEIIIDDANKKAVDIEKDAMIQTKEKVHEYRVSAEQDIKEKYQVFEDTKAELNKKEQSIEKREIIITGKEELMLEKEKDLVRKQDRINTLLEDNETQLREQIKMLEKIAGYSKSEAKKELLNKVQSEVDIEMSAFIKDAEEEAREKSEAVAKNLIASAIQRYSADQSSEKTISSISLPNEEIKGRIIGREGRNIRAIEAATGVDIIIDDTPEVITISCFDPIRREIAYHAIDELIQDGRVQPARIEELVKKNKANVERLIKEAGENAIFELGLTKMSKELVMMVGKLKYRTSYGQSALKHSMEVAFLSGMMAAELGEDEILARRAGLLHDIGKAVDFEQEGSHVELGVKYAKRYNENKIVINAIEAHHGNKPPIATIPILVTAADALSASRPGARMESLQNYIQRLEKLEEIANDFKGVENSYAIQAGREVRVIVKPEEIDDVACFRLARDIKDKIESDLTYPGQIKVSVIRETKANEIAK